MAGAIQTQTRRASDPGLALVERRRDAGLEETKAWQSALTRTPHPSIRKFSWGQHSGWTSPGVVSFSTQFASKSAAELAADERLQPIKPWECRAKVMRASVPRSPHYCC